MQSPHHCRRTNLPVDLLLCSSLTRVQDPEVLELLYLGQDVLIDLEKALHFLTTENNGLRFGGAESHRGGIGLGCEPIQQELEVTD